MIGHAALVARPAPSAARRAGGLERRAGVDDRRRPRVRDLVPAEGVAGSSSAWALYPPSKTERLAVESSDTKRSDDARPEDAYEMYAHRNEPERPLPSSKCWAQDGVYADDEVPMASSGGRTRRPDRGDPRGPRLRVWETSLRDCAGRLGLRSRKGTRGVVAGTDVIEFAPDGHRPRDRRGHP